MSCIIVTCGWSGYSEQALALRVFSLLFDFPYLNVFMHFFGNKGACLSFIVYRYRYRERETHITSHHITSHHIRLHSPVGFSRTCLFRKEFNLCRMGSVHLCAKGKAHSFIQPTWTKKTTKKTHTKKNHDNIT